ncbi:hypothetical protein IAR55_003721 [Kwoniella newhampshirensis]|uniref:Carboxylesterase type B domain-containing protein n=1 Tax=Kwoniella newhampshirensis TaxID=1651941 RepID=A0AAW0Z112_9TREE
MFPSTYVFTGLAAVAAVSAIPSSLTNRDAVPRVTVRNGTLQGAVLPNFNQEFFGGIPYAAPPARFEPPTPALSYNGTLEYTDACWGSGNDIWPQSENCLSLNIVRPAGTDEHSNLPVMFWAHGGGFWGGSGRDQTQNGSYLVQTSMDLGHPIIFVSINYRLLILGYPSGHEAHAAGIENLGLLDQRVALAWVQENIEAFGGNPKKVTFQGERYHLVAYGGRNDNLFSSAIVESGSFYEMPCNYNISDIREATYQKFLADTTCGSLSCLKTLDIDTLYNVSLKYFDQFLPSIDGKLIEKHPAQMWAEGSFIKVPLLMGTNQDEGTILSVTGVDNDTALQAGITSLNATSYVVDASVFPDLLAAYPNDPTQGVPMGTGRGLLASGSMDKRSNVMFGDAIEDSPRRWITGLMAGAGQPTFSYHFRQVPYMASLSIGATHATELAYVFGDPTKTKFDPYGHDESLSLMMRGAWVSFVHHQDPNHKNMDHWPDFRHKKENMAFVINGTKAENDDYRQDGIQIWIDQRIKGCSGLAPKH